jgi:putative SbcD/Mre11-related phosphoesterase
MRVLDDWLLTPARAAVHLPTRTAVVADLHLGYDRLRQLDGEAVPVRSVAEELAPLKTLVTQDIRRLVVAGDLFENGRRGAERLSAELLQALADMGIELVGVIPGNHDRLTRQQQHALPLFVDGLRLGDWQVVHGDQPRTAGRVVQGHEHPWFRWRSGVGGPCYLIHAEQIVLPAFSVHAAGGNVVGKRRWAAHRCCAIAGGEVLDFGELGRLTRQA